MSQQGGVYFEQGTGTLVVPVGTNIRVEGAEANFIIDADTVPLLQILADIPTTDPADDGETIWSDGGVLKVSGASGG